MKLSDIKRFFSKLGTKEDMEVLDTRTVGSLRAILETVQKEDSRLSYRRRGEAGRASYSLLFIQSRIATFYLEESVLGDQLVIHGECSRASIRVPVELSEEDYVVLGNGLAHIRTLVSNEISYLQEDMKKEYFRGPPPGYKR